MPQTSIFFFWGKKKTGLGTRRVGYLPKPSQTLVPPTVTASFHPGNSQPERKARLEFAAAEGGMAAGRGGFPLFSTPHPAPLKAFFPWQALPQSTHSPPRLYGPD